MPNNVAQDARPHTVDPFTASPFAGNGVGEYRIALPETLDGEDTFNRLLSLFESEVHPEDPRCRWRYAGDDEKTFTVSFVIPLGLVARMVEIAQPRSH